MDFKSKKAIYLQIADYVCEQILTKQWSEQQKIPSIRELAVSMEVNPNTVVRSYAFLEDQGVIEMKRGVGYFIAPKALKKVIDLLRAEFINEDLPQVFKTMRLLEIDFGELKQLYGSK